ncbi:L,D-transpeptidase [Herbaspirillum frisingense]|uniref:L,D-transpeptidase n=1 Tax=Herbaspirillum frisingense TaxID=92645 RepID=UPI001F315116|nr:L,D-transpeptidase [Herbaspirillum frisingense]UIN23742.1 L,D-transpeptidase [Herbaspirillum frisingense]
MPSRHSSIASLATALAVAIVALPGAAQSSAGAAVAIDAPELSRLFANKVHPRLQPPESEQLRYLALASSMLQEQEISLAEPQYILVIDRAATVQAALLYWVDNGQPSRLIGATSVSTGRPGGFDHFLTPTGVHRHAVANPDYRALGTRNSHGIRGYGVRGMRVFDLGWQNATRGWGKGGVGTMRLQMHATDPDLLEPLLGTRQSKGCIRIPASLNQLLDEHGVLDAEYQAARNAGMRIVPPMPAGDVTGAGRYVIVVDTETPERPDWALPSY